MDLHSNLDPGLSSQLDATVREIPRNEEFWKMIFAVVFILTKKKGKKSPDDFTIVHRSSLLQLVCLKKEAGNCFIG